jgi:microcystin-dependent protein
MATHHHTLQGSNATATLASPAGNLWGVTPKPAYATSPDGAMAADTTTTAGEGQPHDNMPPYLVLNFVIALQGIFPSRN